MRVVPTQRPGLDISVLDGEAVVLDPATSAVHALNLLALSVLRASGRPLDVVAEDLGVTAADVEAACDDLVGRGLLVAAGWSRRSVIKGGALAAGVALASSIALPAAANAASSTGGGGGAGGPGGGTFVDISASGTPVTSGDDNATTATSDFAIQLYGVSTTTPIVSTNGVIELTGNNTDYSNIALPDGNFGTAAFVYWDDLITTVRTQTVGTAGSRVFIVQWDGNYWPGFGSVSFQAQFFEATPGKVAFLYRDVSTGTANGSGATIGTQQDGSTADQYSFNTASVSDGTVLVFDHP